MQAAFSPQPLVLPVVYLAEDPTKGACVPLAVVEAVYPAQNTFTIGVLTHTPHSHPQLLWMSTGSHSQLVLFPGTQHLPCTH